MDKNNQKQERTEWHRVVVWGKLAELCSQYLAKGRQCYVEGRLQTREYTDKDGVKKYSTEVQAQTIQFLGGQAGAGTGQSQGTGAGNYGSGRDNNPGSFGGGANFDPASAAPTGGFGNGPTSEPSFTEDDIPF